MIQIFRLIRLIKKSYKLWYSNEIFRELLYNKEYDKNKYKNIFKNVFDIYREINIKI